MKNKAIISDIQHFSLGDGPGIRTTVFFKGCNLYCPWCHNPETISTRPQLLFFQPLCTNCGSCAALCQLHNIADQKHIFKRDKCVLCGKCASACPSGALKLYRKTMTSVEIMNDILQDKDFYQQSGGGVTLSGGEPLLQADFCAELAQACQKENLSVIIDTAGNVNYSEFEKVLPYITEIYLDLKGSVAEEMFRLTGARMQLILNNLRRLINNKANVTVRIPIIPEYNDTPESAAEAADIIKEYGPAPVNLIPFHRLGSQKYSALDKKYSYAQYPPINPQALETLAQIFRRAGLEAEIMN